ncbi:MAG: hypothetical protein MJ159_06745 [Treponemataceae bacterium]|nr:hypothetical protein [Treponemataceae bacterium]
MKKRLFLVATMLVFVSVLTFAQSLTIVIVQRDSSTTLVRDMTRLLETSLMDAFFDDGFIVSNEPVVVTGTSNELFIEHLASAGTGGMGYIVPVIIRYGENSGDSTFVELEWEVLSNNYNVYASGIVDQPKLHAALNRKDCEKGLRNFSVGLEKEIGAAIRFQAQAQKKKTQELSYKR